MTDALKINKVAQTIDAINGFTMAVGGKEVYHPDNKPSAADLNVVNKAGDTMAGNLTAPKVLVSAAQGTEANALTRKDYVDGKFAGVTSPTAVLPMVIDANKAISIKPAAANTAGSMSAADKVKLDGIQGFAVNGKSEKLKGPINFDSLESSGFYNLYSAKATGSVNPPPFDYGTMIVIGADKDGNTFVTQLATDQRTGISYTRTRNDDKFEWTSWIENANEFTDFGYQYKTKFEVGGDADKFYPVTIESDRTRAYNAKRYCISRAYNAKAPEAWGSKTHMGGLALAYEFSGDAGWGGNSKNIVVSDFSSTYTTVCGGMYLSTGEMIVWLRGGGAEYYYFSDHGIKSRLTVNLEKYVAPDKKEYFPRTKDEADKAVIDEIMPRFANRNGELYDRNRRVLVADGSIPMTGDLKIEKEQAALILKNAAGATVDKAENYGRIRFEHATGDQHIELMHSVHDEYRAGYGLRLLKPEDNKGGAGAWLDVQGDVFAQNFIQTTAQSTNAASCTRKDYVDAQVAPKLNKSGDTMTGNLTFGNDSQLVWTRNTDWAKIGFKNDSDSDVNSYMWFETGDNKNEYFKFQMHNTTGPKHELLDIKLEKADFHIPIVADQVKNAINVHGKGSISFQDASNTRFHLFSEGNALKINHGNNGENGIVNILSDGAISSIGTFTAKDFLQSTAQTNLPNASTRKDYVDAQIAAIDAKNVTKAGDTMTGILNMKDAQAGAATFSTGASAVFTNGQSNAWYHINRPAGDNGLVISEGVTPINQIANFSVGKIDLKRETQISSGKLQIESSGHNILEFHTPGKHARMIWMDGTTGDLNFGQSNGAYGEAVRYMTMRTDGSGINLNGVTWAKGSHAFLDQHVRQAPFNVDFGTVNGGSDYYQIASGRTVATGAGYTTDTEFGVLRTGNVWGQAVIRVGSGEAATKASQFAYTFDISGNFSAANVRITSDARLKSDFKPIENALYKVEQLTGKTYIKQGKEEREAGIIAQDLQKVLPESVGEFNHADGNKYLSIETAGVNALLIEAFKELSEKVKQLEARGK